MGSCALLLLMGLFGFSTAQTVHKMAIRSDVRFRFATTEVMCIMGNNEDVAAELFFDFTLPKDAFISNFSMEIEGKVYHGDVKEKAKARKQYLEAKESGSTGGLVEQSTRHSNKFDVSVNIAAGGNVTFKLLYQELLRRRFGVYEHSIFLEPNPDIKDFSVEVHVQELTEIQNVRTPKLRKDIINNDVEEEINAMTQISFPSPTSAHVVYKPSPELESGWFVVQYDIDAKNTGELLVVDGYFVHFFLPPDDLPPLPLDIVFVLDISGSMAGRKMNQLKDAMAIILNDLRPSDRFNILLFDGSVQNWEPQLQEASVSNLKRAEQYVKAIQDRGSTDLHRALMEGLKMLQGSREGARIPMIFFLTDGEPTSGVQDPDTIVAEVSKKNEGVVNIYSLAFGDGADYKLLRKISAKNKGFARKIYEASDAAKQVSGLYREISTVVMHGLTIAYESSSNNDDGKDRVKPQDLIWVDNSTITTCVFPTLFGRSDLVVAGKLENFEILKTDPENAGGLKLKVSGQAASGEVSYIFEENDLSSLTLDNPEPSFWTVPRDLSRITERTWAFLTIRQLLKEKEAADAEKIKDLDKKILELSLKYYFVTPLTSMVVTRPEDDINKGEEKTEASLLEDAEVKAAKMLPGSHLGSRVQSVAYYPMGPSGGTRGQPGVHRSPGSRGSYGSRGLPGRPGAHYSAIVSSRKHPTGSHIKGAHASIDVNPAKGNLIAHDLLSESVDYHGLPSLDPFPLVTVTQRTAALLPTWPRRVIWRTTTTTTTTTTSPPVIVKRKKAGKRKNKGGKRKGAGKKRCIRNKKVLLESITVRGTHTPTMCYELKAARKAHNYTILANPVAGFHLTVGLSKKMVTSLLVKADGNLTHIRVNEAGELYYVSPPSPPTPGSESVQLHQHTDYMVSVRTTSHKCKATFISIDIKVMSVDATAQVVRSFQGFAGKAFKAELKKKKKGKQMDKGKKKKKTSGPKKCLASKIPADRSQVLKGKRLMRYLA